MSTGPSRMSAGAPGAAGPLVMVQEAPPVPLWQRVVRGTLWIALAVSLAFNGALYFAWSDYYRNTTPPVEKFHSGERLAKGKIALIKVHGTIMPPFTERWIKQIERAAKDDNVKGILLEIDSPGGLVADSHQIYRKLRELNAKKPIAVSMKRMAASGGYYIAMGAGIEGKIFAEETTWTGSIGVIIPRYEAADLAKKVGVTSDPLKTGPFKDALSPFRELSPEERTVWNGILDDAYERFLRVIAESRPLKPDELRPLATGQIFTAEQAKQNRLIDEIGYEEEALAWLKEKCKLSEACVVTYESQKGLVDLVLGATAKQPRSEVDRLLEASVPRAMYYCSWGLAMPEPVDGGTAP